jgi:predicted aconitase with swiveling domain
VCSFSDKQGTNRAFINKADGSGQSTKGRVQMLADIRGSAAAVRAAKHRNFVPLPNAGAMGTNKAFVNKGDGKGLRGTSKLSGFGTDAAFLHKADGSGQSTKGRVQMLADIRGSGAVRRAQNKKNKKQGYVALPNAGAMGTNKAFVKKGDGKGLRGTSKLSGFGTDAAFLHKADGSGQSTKGKTQQLYEWTGGESQQLMPPFVLLCLSTRVHVRHALPCSVCFVVCCGFADVDLVP